MKKDEANAADFIDVDAAWEAFKLKAKDEPVHESWTRIETVKESPSPAEQRLMADEAGSAAAGSTVKVKLQDNGVRGIRTERITQARTFAKKWGAAAVAAVVAGTVLFTPMGSKALAGVLGSFRIQHLQTVSISNGDLEKLQKSLTEGTAGLESFDLSQFGTVDQEGGGQPRQMTAAEAAKVAGYPLKTLPGQTGDDRLVQYQPELKLTFRLHTGPINKLFAQLGGKSKLPSSVDGKPITVEIPAMIHSGAADGKEPQATKNLMQLASPVLTVPDGVDVEEVRKAVLDLPVLPAELRAKLEAVKDWKTTLPIPVIGENTREVQVEGLEAILGEMGAERAVVWLDNGRIYALAGSGADYPTDEAILKEAGEIAKQ